MNRVHIELQRVQTWLFAVPRLRAMVGANTLLGEVLRDRLPELAREQSSWQLAKGTLSYPSALPEDPLSNHDDPVSDAQDGILSRDGGHFEANFESGAEKFADAAASLLRRELPGIRFRISVDDDDQERSGANLGLSTELPVLEPCKWTGRGLGSLTMWQGEEATWVSLDVKRRHDAAKRAEEGAADLASLLLATTSLKNLSRALEFETLAGRGYLALVHADGNGVGSAAQGLQAEQRASFFHRNRVLLRRAVQTAMDRVCQNAVDRRLKVRPLQPLMLGGDDLLVVCRAEVALRFVVWLCEALADIQDNQQSAFKLTLGIGVVVARPTIPINRQHEVVEQLAASAKRRFRGFSPKDRRSVVDWAVYTTSFMDDPEEVRRRDWVRATSNEMRVLSRRPVDVLGAGLERLQGLVSAADKLKDAPRSQLRYLVDQLPKGRALSELTFKELSREARHALDNAGVREVWSGAEGAPLLTSLLDLVEIYEISNLGRAGTETAGTIGEQGSE